MSIYISNLKVRKELQRKGITEAQANGKYKGRRNKNINTLLFDELKKEYKEHKITAEKASKQLEVSSSTFIRRINETKNK